MFFASAYFVELYDASEVQKIVPEGGENTASLIGGKGKTG